MCLRSFSISTEVLFIRLKPIIYATAGKKQWGNSKIVATVGDTDIDPGRASELSRERERRTRERESKNGMRCNSCN